MILDDAVFLKFHQRMELGNLSSDSLCVLNNPYSSIWINPFRRVSQSYIVMGMWRWAIVSAVSR